MKRLWLLAALAGTAIVQADYFGEYFDANPMPLTGTVNGAGDIDLVWPAADEICKTQIFKNGVLLDATEDFTYTDPAYTAGDTYEVLFQSCRNHVHTEPSNTVPDDPIVVQSKEALLANIMDTGEEDTRAGVFAFPGATGHARFATGGRGGAAVVVNTLNDVNVNGDGLVSWREAATGINEANFSPRTILFSVSGQINTGTNLVAIHGQDDVTVACQSAPPPGVVFVGWRSWDIDNGTDDLIARHCDIKPLDTINPNLNTGQRCVTIGGNTGTGPRRLMFDHFSCAWSTDDSISSFVNTNGATDPPGDITISHPLIYEGDTTCLRSDDECGNPASGFNGTYAWPSHAMGPYFASQNGTRMDGVSLIAWASVNNNARQPWWRNVSGEIVNGLVANRHSEGIAVTGSGGATNNLAYIVGNTIKEGPDERPGTDPLKTAAGTFSISGNRLIDDNGVLQNSNLDGNGGNALSGLAREYLGGSNELDLSCIGASQPTRDSSDARIVTEINGAGPGSPILASAEVGVGPRIAPINPPCTGIWCFYEPPENGQGQRDYSTYTSSNSHPASYDTDGDGIEDAWEQQVIDSDPNDAITNLTHIDHTTDCDGDGYTDMEEFLNRLARCDI